MSSKVPRNHRGLFGASDESSGKPSQPFNYPKIQPGSQDQLRDAFSVQAALRKSPKKKTMKKVDFEAKSRSRRNALFDEPDFDEPDFDEPNFDEPNFDEPDDDLDMGEDDADGQVMNSEALDEAATAQLLEEATSSKRPSRSRAQQQRGKLSQNGSAFLESVEAAKEASARMNEEWEQTPALNPLISRPPNLDSYMRGAHSLPTAPEPQLTPGEIKEQKLDQEMIGHMTNLRLMIHAYTNRYFDGQIAWDLKGGFDSFLQSAMEKVGPELVSYTGCVADGGPGGKDGWINLLYNVNNRKALVFGIIQRALKEHVFGSLLFGAPEDLLASLTEMEKQQSDQEGFLRCRSRAQAIISHQIHYRQRIPETPERAQAVLEMTLKLRKLLAPIQSVQYDPKNKSSNRRLVKETKDLLSDLHVIVHVAADIAYHMRINGDTVIYQFLPVFKDETIDLVRMDPLNYEDLRNDYSKRAEDSDQALVRVVCAHGLVAYRQGGGVMAERILEKEENEPDYSVPPEWRHLPRNVYRGRVITAKDGFRTKVLAKAVVAGRVGKPRTMGEMTDAAGNEYVELVDLGRGGGGAKGAGSTCGMM